jgi:multidrug efflux system membrane fusion protein
MGLAFGRILRWAVWLVILVAVVLAGYYVWTHYIHPGSGTTTADKAGEHGKHGADQARIVTAVATRTDMPVYIKGLGAVTPLNTVTVQSRVNGQLMKVLFTEGQMVKENDPLLLIDPRPYQVQLEQQQAQQEHDQAVLDDANIDLQRYQTLWQQDSIPKQTLDTQASLVKQDQATVDTDKALIDATQLNITYCNIASPIDGRVGLRLVDVGNYIQIGSASTSSAGLLVITQIQPITVIFTIPEDNIDSVVTAMRATPELPVDAYARGGFDQKISTGTLLTIDNQIDPTTGTVKLRATFANTDNSLFPNQFVNTRMLVDTRKSIVTVPIAAVQHGTGSNTYVYTVDTAASTVKLQTVQTGAVSFDGQTQEITSGVNAGDTVVTDGVDKLSDGMKVIITKPDSGAADSSDAASDSSTDGQAASSTDASASGQQQHHKKKPQSGDTNAAPAS